jgi:hypothetical protein
MASLLKGVTLKEGHCLSSPRCLEEAFSETKFPAYRVLGNWDGMKSALAKKKNGQS